jgi:ABC-type uncharacterized transport system ATPase subunit
MSTHTGRMAVEMAGIKKAFRNVVAIRKADFSVREGEIHALIGENGAGKSTLMSILYGLYEPDAGEIKVFGDTVTRLSPTAAVDLGLGMVHQHFMLIPPFTALENIVLGIEKSRGIFLDTSETAEKVQELGEKYGLTVDLNARVENLSVSMQQRVEILKVLVRGARVLILDEPTAVLTPQEVVDFFKILQLLRNQGSTVILITHKLKEVKALSDRLTVMREGQSVATVDTESVTQADIAQMMVGRPVLFAVDKRPKEPGEVRLAVAELVYEDAGRRLLDGVDLTVRSGEIVGLAGVSGNGQTELVEALVGLLPVQSGTVRLDGAELLQESVLGRLERGLAHVPEDRLLCAICPDFSLSDNLILGLHEHENFSKSGLLNHTAIEKHARALIAEYDVRPPQPDVPIRQLSGGNQQKLVIARECSRKLRLLIAALPTRGVDIGAIEFIHQRLVSLRDQGVAILLVSSELSEILSLSDRIAVMYRGRIVKTFDSGQAGESELGLAMAGVA